MPYLVGVDIGGTKTNFVLGNGPRNVLGNFELRIIRKKTIPTPKNKKEIVKSVEENIKLLTADFKHRGISSIGIGVPSALNPGRDLILNPPNLKCLKNFPLAKIVGRGLKIRTEMENDAKCFTLAEAILGAAKGAKAVFGITLGTGLGGGLILNGKIYRGFCGSAGEIGHTIIKYDGRKCACGNFGCLEAYCSEQFFKRKGLSPKEVKEKAERGEKLALEIFEEYGRYLGIGLVDVVNLLAPEVIVIGGGIAKANKFFLKEAKREMKKRIISPFSRQCVKIKIGKLGDYAGAIGAALLAANDF